MSLNQYVVYTLTRNAKSAYTVQVLPDAAIQQQVERFNALLQRLGTLEHDAMQGFLDNREVEAPEDEETATLIARVEEQLKMK